MVKEIKLIQEPESTCCAPVPAVSEACCETDSTSTACCPTPEATSRELPLWRSIGIFLGLITSFVISDYWFGSFLKSRFSAFDVKAADSLAFFISHSIGLLSLLAAITTAAVFLRSFIDADKVRKHMEKVGSIRGHGVAAGIGVATPFCSCSAVPVFTGFIRGGVPVSQAISFLVASPLVNEIAVIMLASTVGGAIAGAYAAMGFAIAVGAGILFYATRIDSSKWALALGAVLGGIFGNLNDRIFNEPGALQGAVVDWISIPYWPTFNIADSAVVIGILSIVSLIWARIPPRSVSK